MQINLRINGKTLYGAALHLIIVALGIEVFILARQNEDFKTKQDLQALGKLKVGDFFAIDGLSALHPPTESPQKGESKQVVFVLSTTCKFCKANLPSWKNIASVAKDQKLPVFAISIDSLSQTKSYIETNDIREYAVYVPIDMRKFAQENRISGVPMTILRSQTGNIENIWLGLLEEKEIEEIIKKISS